jgi:hypothetical protein
MEASADDSSTTSDTSLEDNRHRVEKPAFLVETEEEEEEGNDDSFGSINIPSPQPGIDEDLSSLNDLSQNFSHHSLSLHGKHSTHSTNSYNSHGSLKVFRHAGDMKNTGHDSLSFLRVADEQDETENAADEDDLKVLCSRDSKRLKLLGEGAFGQVFLVRYNHKSYALKVCAKYDLLTEGAVHEVVREREIMSQLDHPFIARIWATNQDKDFVYILEDYLGGGEFYSVLERRPNQRIDAEQAQVYAACIADALAYLHTRKIVYRDLKPENVMISKRGFPVLIDFGCAKQLTAQEHYLTQTLCGTPRFSSPEMIDPASFGGGHSFGTDHWALGILMFESVAGESPFWCENMPDHELFEVVLIIEPSWKVLEDLAIPADCIDFVKKLLIKDNTKRLGAGGETEVLQHSWLAPVNVHDMGRVKAPWVPDLTDPTDTQYFDEWEDQLQSRFEQKYPSLTPKEELQFAGF